MKNSLSRRLQVATGAFAATCLLAAGQFAATAESKVVLDSGHTDLFNVTAQKDGSLLMQVKEDITGQHVLRSPEEVELVVKDAAYTNETEGIEQIGVAGYVLPQVEDKNLLWAGWDTLGVMAGGYNAIDFNFRSVQGPGDVYLFILKGFGEVNPLINGDNYKLQTGSVITQPYPAHTHFYWVFTKPGKYVMEVQASGEKDGKTVNSNVGVYNWTVAPEEMAKQAAAEAEKEKPEETPSPEESPKPSETATPEKTPAPTETGQPSDGGKAKTPKPITQPAPTAPKAPAPTTPKAPAQATATCFPHQEGGAGAETLLPRMKDDRVAPPRWVDPASLPFAIGQAGVAKTPSTIGAIPKGKQVWMIGQTQVRGVPWLGANTQNASVVNKTTGPVTWQITSFSGPGAMEVFTSSGRLTEFVGQKWFSGNGNSASGSITIPANSHVHPNWVFSAPGTYRVGITQTATKKDGSRISGQTTLTFNVGSSNGVTDGHFDLGAEIGAAGSKTVWRDAQGRFCTPTAVDYQAAGMTGGGALASTGASDLTLPLAVLALGVGVLGAGMVRYRRAL